MSNIKNNFKKPQDFDENQFIESQNHETVRQVEELKKKLSGFLIP
jgi:hypothetical protein